MYTCYNSLIIDAWQCIDIAYALVILSERIILKKVLAITAYDSETNNGIEIKNTFRYIQE